MITRFDLLRLLLCHVILKGQFLACHKWHCSSDCPSAAPSPTTAICTCNCSTPTPLQTIASPSPTTIRESPYPTTEGSQSSTLNSSAFVLKCPTLSTTAHSPGSIIGAAIGGAIFGSILTVIVFVCLRRKLYSPDASKEEPTSNVVRNGAYHYNNEQIDSVDSASRNSTYSEIHHDETRKAAQMSPVMRQEDTLKKEEVYNHLHEIDKEDRSEYYDHAGPASSLSVMEDGYGVLSVESGGTDNYNTVDGNYSTDRGESMTAENKQSDDYFILETQKE